MHRWPLPALGAADGVGARAKRRQLKTQPGACPFQKPPRWGSPSMVIPTFSPRWSCFSGYFRTNPDSESHGDHPRSARTPPRLPTATQSTRYFVGFVRRPGLRRLATVTHHSRQPAAIGWYKPEISGSWGSPCWGIPANSATISIFPAFISDFRASKAGDRHVGESPARRLSGKAATARRPSTRAATEKTVTARPQDSVVGSAG